MSKHEKLVERLKSCPKDFTNEEAETLFSGFGYIKDTKGKASGSRIAFRNEETNAIFLLHTSHPGNQLKVYVVKAMLGHLKERGLL